MLKLLRIKVTLIFVFLAQLLFASLPSDPYRTLNEAYELQLDGSRVWTEQWRKHEYDRAIYYLSVKSAYFDEFRGQSSEAIETIETIRASVIKAIEIFNALETSLKIVNNPFEFIDAKFKTKTSILESLAEQGTDFSPEFITSLAGAWAVTETVAETDETLEGLFSLQQFFAELNSDNVQEALAAMRRAADPSLAEDRIILKTLMDGVVDKGKFVFSVWEGGNYDLFSPTTWNKGLSFDAAGVKRYVIEQSIRIANDLIAAKTLSETVIQVSNTQMLAFEFLDHYYLGFKGDRDAFEVALGKQQGASWNLEDALKAFLNAQAAWGGTFADRYRLDLLTRVLTFGDRTEQQALSLIEDIIRYDPVLFGRPEVELVDYVVQPNQRPSNIVMVGDVYKTTFLGESYISDDAPLGIPSVFCPPGSQGGACELASSNQGIGNSQEWQSNPGDATHYFIVQKAGDYHPQFTLPVQDSDGNWSERRLIKFDEVAYAPLSSLAFNEPILESISAQNASIYTLDLVIPDDVFMGTGIGISASEQNPLTLKVRSTLSGKELSQHTIQSPGLHSIVISLPFNETQVVYNGGAIELELSFSIGTDELVRADTVSSDIVRVLTETDYISLAASDLDLSNAESVSYEFSSGVPSDFDAQLVRFSVSENEQVELCFYNTEPPFYDDLGQQVWGSIVWLNAFYNATPTANENLGVVTLGGTYQAIYGELLNNNCMLFNFPQAGEYRLNGLGTKEDDDFGRSLTLSLYEKYSLVTGVAQTNQPNDPGDGDTGNPSLPATHPLNDTGITFCGEASDGNNRPCTGNEPAGQDAHYGRDAAYAAGVLEKVGSGHAGFDYTKIANNGSELPADAELGPGPNDWACTRDNVTGLLWEVKVDDESHLRHEKHRYTWYNIDIPDGSTYSCNNTMGGENCTIENYIQAVNDSNLCGYSDWQMPSRLVLVSIVNYDRASPSIDTSFFVNASSSVIWTGSPYSSYSNASWAVGFAYGYASGYPRSYYHRVRLLRGGL